MNRYPHPADMNPDATDPRSPYYDAHWDERADELLAEFRDDPVKVEEADEWACGTHEASHYTELESAMADLAETEPADLIGSEVLERLYRLAKVHGAAREAKLRDMANAAARDERDANEEMRDFYRRGRA